MFIMQPLFAQLSAVGGTGRGPTPPHPPLWLQAQKIRTRAETHFRRVFEEGGCHYIVTPTVPCLAPAINRAALSSGGLGGGLGIGGGTALPLSVIWGVLAGSQGAHCGSRVRCWYRRG